MVRAGLFILIICLIWPAMLLAAEFTASVDRNQVAVGERLSLMLELHNVSSDGQPDTSVLYQYFDVTPGGQSSKTSIINGDISSSTRWQYMLVPKQAGTVTIPEIPIQTAEGEARSQSIALTVSEASSLPDSDKTQNISLSAKASKRDPYKNEPITYALTLVTQQNLANVQLSELKMDDAIIETIKEPAIYDRVFNGVPVKIIEASYRITPLKPGSITVPPIIVQGDVVTRDRRSRFGSLFNDESDPFFDRLGAFGFNKLVPFSVASNEITLDVKPPVGSVQPWLPAESITLSEHWDSAQTFQVGEPITRFFTIRGKGVAASQLSNLDKQLKAITGFKVYADQPETKNKVDNETLISLRKENYTLIPQQAGTLTLPEITVTWWNTKEHKVEQAILEARTLQVIPGVQNNQTVVPMTNTPPMPNQSDKQSPSEATVTPQTVTVDADQTILYAIIAGLAIVLSGVMAWVIYLQRKLKKLTQTSENRQRQEDGALKPVFNEKAFAGISSATELQHYLQNYSEQYWQTPKNASLETIFNTVKNNNPDISEEVDKVLKALQDALYANKPFDMESVKQACQAIFKVKNQHKRRIVVQQQAIEKLPDLNPS